MNHTHQKEHTDVIGVILGVLSVLLLISLLSKIIKDFSSDRGSGIITDEGNAILEDKERSKEVIRKVEHYHETGKW